MIILFSPTRQMDFSAPLPPGLPDSTLPLFAQEARMLNLQLAQMGVGELAGMMKISLSLAKESYRRIQEFDKAPGRPALFTYSGTSFKALNAMTLDFRALDFAQKHLRILSGMYGLVRPLDRIAPHRLEMNSPFFVEAEKDARGTAPRLKAFWKARLTQSLKQDAEFNHEDDLMLDLASKEYGSAVDRNLPGRRVITISFQEDQGGILKTIGMYAKKARGLLLRQILSRGICNLEDVKILRPDSYKYCKQVSSTFRWVFVRPWY